MRTASFHKIQRLSAAKVSGGNLFRRTADSSLKGGREGQRFIRFLDRREKENLIATREMGKRQWRQYCAQINTHWALKEISWDSWDLCRRQGDILPPTDGTDEHGWTRKHEISVLISAISGNICPTDTSCCSRHIYWKPSTPNTEEKRKRFHFFSILFV